MFPICMITQHLSDESFSNFNVNKNLYTLPLCLNLLKKSYLFGLDYIC